MPTFPAARQRPRLQGTPLELRYERIESTRGFVTLGDADADVIRFSGQVDAVDVWVETFGAVLTFCDRDNVEVDTITLRVGQTYASRFACSTVRARNAVGGSNATVQCVGKWARRASATGATSEPRSTDMTAPPLVPPPAVLP
jgi:hypothetical protein